MRTLFGIFMLATFGLCACHTMNAAVMDVGPKAPVIPVIENQLVNIPVAHACVPDDFPRTPPVYPDTKEAIAKAPTIREVAQAIGEANVELHQRNDTLEAIVKGCE